MVDQQAGWTPDDIKESIFSAPGGLPLLPSIPPPPYSAPTAPPPLPSAPVAPPPGPPSDVWIAVTDRPATGRGKMTALLIGAVVLIAAVGGGVDRLVAGGSTPSPIQSPAEANSMLFAAAVNSGSFHYVSASTDVGGGTSVTATQTGDVGQNEGVQYMNSAVGDYTVVVVGSAAYMKANLSMLENMLGYSPSEAAPFVNQWIAFGPSESLYKAVAADVTTETTWNNSSVSPTDQLPQTPESVSGLSTLDGESAQTVRYSLEGNDTTADTTYTGSESITFAATEPHLPLVVTERLSGMVGQQASHFLSSYVELLIQTCHRRGIHAMGGMAAQIPIRNDPAANEQALDKVRRDKLREVKAGHDGTWVAHPGLVPIAKQIFDQYMPEPNQISIARIHRPITAKDLLEVPKGEITEKGLRWNIDVGLQYVWSWLRGNGCVPIYNLMEDAATAEICRAQVWQWVKHGARLTDGKTTDGKTSAGKTVTAAMVKQILEDRISELQADGNDRKLRQAAQILDSLMTGKEFPDFLTLASYDLLD